MASDHPTGDSLPSRSDAIVDRHLGPRPADIDRMLRALRLASLDALIDRAIPASIRTRRPLDLPAPRGERDIMSDLAEIAERNRVFRSYIGMGYHDTVGGDRSQRSTRSEWDRSR